MISEEEMTLVNNTEWIITKQLLIKKVYDLFGILHNSFQKRSEAYVQIFPMGISSMQGKISKGENYRSLPYVILDYPAFYFKENVFVIRTMFWWGHFFSITLQLSGKYKSKFICEHDKITEWLQEKNYFICINHKEWEHHFDTDNYLPTCSLTKEQLSEIMDKPFLKISKNSPLTEWNNAEVFLKSCFEELLEFLQINYQGDETNLSPGFPIVDSGL